MPFSSGTFSRVHDWTSDRDAGIKISASRTDAEFDGIATGLTTCILKDGTQTLTAMIPFTLGLSVPTDKKIQLRDSAIFINSSADGQLNVAADTSVTITTPSLIVSGGAVFNEDSANADFRVESNNNTHMIFVDGENDKVMIGLETPDVFNGTTPPLQIEGTDNNKASLSITRNSNDNGQPLLILSKSRGTAVNSDTIVQDNDVIGEIVFLGADGTDRNNQVASISAEIDGTPGTDDTPGALIFRTTADGSNSAAERMRIDNAGDVTISRAETDGTVRLNLSNTGSNGSSEYSEIKFNSTAGSTVTSIVQHRNNSGMNIGTTTDHPVSIIQNNAQALTVNASGDIDVETGDIFFSTAGKGINLGVTSNTDSNTLDDYEEGTWDVAVACGTSGSITIRSDYNEGYYNKVGTLVHAQGYIVVGGVSSPSGYISIGLPFVVANTSSEGGDWSTASVTIQGSAKNVNQMNATLISGGSQSILVYASDATTLQADSAEAIAADDSIYFSCTYRSG